MSAAEPNNKATAVSKANEPITHIMTPSPLIIEKQFILFTILAASAAHNYSSCCLGGQFGTAFRRCSRKI